MSGMPPPKYDNRGRMHYRGDRTNSLGRIMGPNLFGEQMTVSEATYDQETDTTTLVMQPTLPTDLETLEMETEIRPDFDQLLPVNPSRTTRFDTP